MTPYLRAFWNKFRHADRDVRKAYDDWWIGLGEIHFKQIAEDEGMTKKQAQKFLDLMYKVIFVKGEYDERYDNILVGDAIRRVKGGRR